MRFDIDSRLKYIFDNVTFLTSDEKVSVIEEIGNEAFKKIEDMIFAQERYGNLFGNKGKKLSYQHVDKTELTTIKQSYLKHKQTKEYLIGYETSPFSIWDSVLDAKNYLIQEVVDEGMFYSYDVDKNFLYEVCRYTSKQFEDENGNVIQLKGSPYDEIKDEIKKVIQQYIKYGYNPYNLMNSALKQYNDSKEQNRKETDEEVIKDNDELMTQCLDVCTLLENCERTFSPYRKIFEVAEHLGELINKSKEFQKANKVEESLKVDEEIEDYKQKIEKNLLNCEFDLQELESVIAGKSHYVKEREIGFNYQSADYDLYQGLLALKKIIHFKVQKNLNLETKV